MFRLVLLFIVLASGSAWAQTAAPAQRGQSAVLNASASVGYDGNVFASQGIVDPRTASEAPYSQFNADLAYSAQGRRISFGSGLHTSVQRFGTEVPITPRSFGGSAGVSVEASRRLQLGASLAASWSSYYMFSTFPQLGEPPLGQPPPPSLDYALTATPGTTFQTRVGASYNVSRRGTISADFSRLDSIYDEEALSLSTNSWTGRYTHGLTRYASARLGYGVQSAEYVANQNYENRLIDVGIDYSRPLSFSRRTKFTFGVGSAGLNDGRTTQFTLVGNANLAHELGRTWTANLAYNRGVGFVNGFAEPFIADSFSVGTEGGLGRRVSFSASAGYSNGSVGLSSLTSTTPPFESYTAIARAQFDIQRTLAAFVQYSFYGYEFADEVDVPQGAPQDLTRSGIGVGLQWTFPLF